MHTVCDPDDDGWADVGDSGGFESAEIDLCDFHGLTDSDKQYVQEWARKDGLTVPSGSAIIVFDDQSITDVAAVFPYVHIDDVKEQVLDAVARFVARVGRAQLRLIYEGLLTDEILLSWLQEHYQQIDVGRLRRARRNQTS
jgi:hypothetical protein